AHRRAGAEHDPERLRRAVDEWGARTVHSLDASREPAVRIVADPIRRAVTHEVPEIGRVLQRGRERVISPGTDARFLVGERPIAGHGAGCVVAAVTVPELVGEGPVGGLFVEAGAQPGAEDRTLRTIVAEVGDARRARAVAELAERLSRLNQTI